MMTRRETVSHDRVTLSSRLYHGTVLACVPSVILNCVRFLWRNHALSYTAVRPKTAVYSCTTLVQHYRYSCNTLRYLFIFTDTTYLYSCILTSLERHIVLCSAVACPGHTVHLHLTDCVHCDSDCLWVWPALHPVALTG